MNEPSEGRMEEADNEAELSDDEFEELSFDDLSDQVESDDPSLTNVKISTLSTIVLPNNNALQHRLERLGTAIGRNTQLNALMFDDYELIGEEQINEAQVVNLFLGIACNQSIRRLHFEHCGEYLENICRILAPLFKNNQVERIHIHGCSNLSPESTRFLATSLAMFDSLKEFVLTSSSNQGDPDSQQAARDLVQSLSGHSRLRKIDLSGTDVGKLGCSALADLLSNQDINLRVLDLACNNLGNAEAAALASGMAGNVSLTEINLADNADITAVGWQAIFDSLNCSGCRLEKLTLGGNEINAAAAQSLSSVLLTSNTTLKTLDLGFNHSITVTGWRVLFDFLLSQTCALEGLDLNGNQLNDEVMTSLTDALVSNRSLKSLNLNDNDEVTGATWQRFVEVSDATWQRFFSTVLANPSSGLEKLDLGGCGINNAAIRALTHALMNNSKLKVLYLTDNDLITNASWEMFSSILESPDTALEELNVQGNVISNATLTSLVDSLAGNTKLKELLFWYSDDWEPPLSVVCNADSIMSTYNSNHTLEKLGWRYEDEMPEEFESLLQINRENSPSQAARLKIIKTHFSGGFITQPFVGMNLNVLPYAMAWMGRDARAGKVDGGYFNFIKTFSSLFEDTN